MSVTSITSGQDAQVSRENWEKNSPWVEKWRATFWDLRESGSEKAVHVWSLVPYGRCCLQMSGAPKNRVAAQVLIAMARDVDKRHPKVVEEFLGELVGLFGYVLARRPEGDAATTADVIHALAHSMEHGAELEHAVASALADQTLDPGEARQIAAGCDARRHADEQLKETALRAAAPARNQNTG